MKEISVFGKGGELLAHVHGEAMLDAAEGTLIIHGEELLSTMTFNWDNVLAVYESPMREDLGE